VNYDGQACRAPNGFSEVQIKKWHIAGYPEEPGVRPGSRWQGFRCRRAWRGETQRTPAFFK